VEPRPPSSTPLPYTTLSRSLRVAGSGGAPGRRGQARTVAGALFGRADVAQAELDPGADSFRQRGPAAQGQAAAEPAGHRVRGSQIGRASCRESVESRVVSVV